MKKGFTLLELIGAVTILGIIALLAFPPILNLINSSKKDISEATKNLIFIATDSYINQNINDFPKTNGKIYCIKIKDLVTSDLLTDNLRDAETNEKIDLNDEIEIKYSRNEFSYSLNNDCIPN